MTFAAPEVIVSFSTFCSDAVFRNCIYVYDFKRGYPEVKSHPPEFPEAAGKLTTTRHCASKALKLHLHPNVYTHAQSFNFDNQG